MQHESTPGTSPSSPSFSRRTVLEAAALGAGVVAGTAAFGAPQDAAKPVAHTLPDLGYAVDALEPVIGKRIMELHHGKHHAAYVKGLNTALEKYPALAAQSLDTLLANLERVPEDIRTAVRNHGGGHANHTLFWQLMGPPAADTRGAAPSGALADALSATFGDLAKFQEAFEKAGAAQFGSGWVWLTLAKGGKLAVETTANQDTPVSAGREVVLGNDVWEHAYYLTYENRRADYLKAWWQVVDWKAVDARFAAAQQKLGG